MGVDAGASKSSERDLERDDRWNCWKVQAGVVLCGAVSGAMRRAGLGDERQRAQRCAHAPTTHPAHTHAHTHTIQAPARAAARSPATVSSEQIKRRQASSGAKGAK